MNSHKAGLAIIFHSGSFDRIYHGLSIVLAGLALGREVKLFFTYWALEYLKKDTPSLFKFDAEAQKQREVLEKNIERGHMQKFSELIRQSKAMGVKIYACTSSMGLLNIARDELIPEVDKTMGLTTFLVETKDSQILFI